MQPPAGVLPTEPCVRECGHGRSLGRAREGLSHDRRTGYLLAALAVVVVVCAAPALRSRAHNLFEITHRYGGWTAIAVFWALTVHLAVVQRGDRSALAATLSSWRSGS